MTLVDPNRQLIHVEGARFRSANSEELIQRQGGMSNHTGLYQFDTYPFHANGNYGNSILTLPKLGFDGLFQFPFDAEIINISMWNFVAGSGGTTEIDIKLATTSGGPFVSIFSVTPKITSAAGADTFFLSYTITENLAVAAGQTWAVNATPPTGCTPGQLTSVPLYVNAGDALRADIINRMPDAQHTGLRIYYRPR